MNGAFVIIAILLGFFIGWEVAAATRRSYRYLHRHRKRRDH